MPTFRFFAPLALCTALFIASTSLQAAEADAELQAKIDTAFKQVEQWAANPVIVHAVAAQNAALPAELADITQDKWKAFSVLDPVVRGFTRNEAATFLKAQKTAWLSEAFVSDAEGRKVAFLAKTSNWSHAGKAKHTEPMKGNHWQGAAEVDESTGQKQIQISVPVLDQGKPIGSLVVGLSLSKLE
jgi:hypothetical protein